MKFTKFLKEEIENSTEQLEKVHSIIYILFIKKMPNQWEGSF